MAARSARADAASAVRRAREPASGPAPHARLRDQVSRTVSDSHPDSDGCTQRPNVHAELSDAPYRHGQSFADNRNGIRISVVGEDAGGTYRVRVTRSPLVDR